MRPRALAVLAAGLALACGGHGLSTSKTDVTRLSPDERARYDCRVEFAACAPDANYPPGLDVAKADVRTLVRIAWRLDLDDGLCERAGKRLRKLAERDDVATVREIAQAAEVASATLGRCRCKGDAFQPEYEKQRIGTVVAGRLPPAELSTPGYWAERIDPHLTALRALSRRSAELVALGDSAGSTELEAQVSKEERALCESVHAARDSLPQGGMSDLRELLANAHVREFGEASVDASRRALDRAERQESCAERPE